MKIGVCMKQVPVSEARVTVSDPSQGVDASVYERTMSTIYDECALEQAVLLKEAGSAAEVVVFMVDVDGKAA